MPSHRMIDPAFWRSETVEALSIARRYFFIGLLSNADDQGRLRAHPALLRAQIYPFDDISLDQIRDDLAELAEGGCITLYSADGKDYMQFPNWWKYQRPRWARPSDHPPPEGWADRIRYRRGNTVIQDNWDGTAEAPASGPDEDELAKGSQPEEPQPATKPAPGERVTTVEPSRARGGPTVGSPRGQGGLAPGPAPSSRGRDRGRDRDRNRGRDSGSNRGSSSGRGGPAVGGPRPPPTAVAAGPERNILALCAVRASHGVGEPRLTSLVNVTSISDKEVEARWRRLGTRENADAHVRTASLLEGLHAQRGPPAECRRIDWDRSARRLRHPSFTAASPLLDLVTQDAAGTSCLECQVL